MAIENYKKINEDEWMVALSEVAFLKWDEVKAQKLSQLMDNTEPKKMSVRKLSSLAAELGYSITHQTIQKMRTGVLGYVATDAVVGVCAVFDLDLDIFLRGPLVKMKKM